MYIHDDIDLKKIESQIWASGFKEVIGLAKLVIKYLIVVHGGALIALLAFLGNITTKSCKIPENINVPLGKFSWGLSLAIFCGMLAYLYQTLVIESVTVRQQASPASKKIYNCIRILACLLAFVSLYLFIHGCYTAIEVFSSIK